MAFKKKKNQVRSPSPESCVPETGSDPPIGSDRDSGRDTNGAYHLVILGEFLMRILPFNVKIRFL